MPGRTEKTGNPRARYQIAKKRLGRAICRPKLSYNTLLGIWIWKGTQHNHRKISQLEATTSQIFFLTLRDADYWLGIQLILVITAWVCATPRL